MNASEWPAVIDSDFGGPPEIVTCTMPRPELRDGAGDDRIEPRSHSLSRGSSVSELVKNYDDVSGKRDRSESGDSSAPSVKRGAPDREGEPRRSPSSAKTSLREHFDAALEALESRMNVFLSTELHTLRDVVQSQLDTLSAKVSDLERHVETSDAVIEELSQQLRESKEEIIRMKTRAEESEIVSRLPCLILSGGAMAARHAPRLPARGTARPAGRPAGAPGQETRTAAVTRPEPAEDAREAQGRRTGHGDIVSEEEEDVTSLVVNTLNRCMDGLNMNDMDIDRAHRLPGANNRVIVRFVRSGAGSIRDQVMWRRLELKGKDLYVNESLTPLRNRIYRSLLNARKERKLYTVYSRGGRVFFKPEKFAAGVRVDSLEKVRQLGFSVEEEGQPRAARGGGGGGGGRRGDGRWETAARQ